MTQKVSFAHSYGYFCCYLEMQRYFLTLSLDEGSEAAALEIIYRALWGARNSFRQLTEEEKYSVYGLPLYLRTVFRLYVSNVCDLRLKWDQAKRDKENLNRKLQNEIKERAKDKKQIKQMEDKIRNLQVRLKGLETSETFMIGRIIMWLPRKLKSLLKI